MPVETTLEKRVAMLERLRRSVISVNVGGLVVAFPPVALVPLGTTAFNLDPEQFVHVNTAGNYYVEVKRPCTLRVSARLDTARTAGALDDQLFMTSESYDPGTGIWTVQETFWTLSKVVFAINLSSFVADYYFQAPVRDMRWRLRIDSGGGAHTTIAGCHMELERIWPI